MMTLPDEIQSPFHDGKPKSLRIQSILYRNDAETLERAIVSLKGAAEQAKRAGLCENVQLVYGDSSPNPTLTEANIERFRGLLDFDYVFFNDNKGSAKGHNELAADCGSDFLLIMNPDVIVAPQTVVHLFVPFKSSGVGLTEGKQVPIEHPKAYNSATGETSWASTACAMVPMSLFRKLEGFDADTFFLYCDDVDFSWRIREGGYKVMFQPAALAFHDKRLSQAATWVPSASESYYSAEAALLMAHKWSRPDLVERYLSVFQSSDSKDEEKAASTFLSRQQNGRLPTPRDPAHRIGEFLIGNYAVHRFSL